MSDITPRFVSMEFTPTVPPCADFGSTYGFTASNGFVQAFIGGRVKPMPTGLKDLFFTILDYALCDNYHMEDLRFLVMESLNEGARFNQTSVSADVLNAWKEEFVEAAEDRLRDRRMERGGVDGNTRYDRPPARKATNAELGIKPGKTQLQKDAEKKYGKGVSAMDIVRAEIRAKHGKGAIMNTKKK